MNIFDKYINIMSCMLHVIKFYTSHFFSQLHCEWKVSHVQYYAYIYLKVLYKYFLVTYILLNIIIVNYKAMNTSYTRRPDFIQFYYAIYIYIYKQK